MTTRSVGNISTSPGSVLQLALPPTLTSLNHPAASVAGSNSFHNANRLTVKRETGYVDRCAYLSAYREVGYGWCRPIVPWVHGGLVPSYASCAAACTAHSTTCTSFARMDSGACALYALAATNSSGESGVRCFTRK